MSEDQNSTEQLQQLMQVVRGNPTPEELATVIALIAAANAEAQQQIAGLERKLTSTWSRNASMLRGSIQPGPGQWKFASRTR
jgi:hypothetical protein